MSAIRKGVDVRPEKLNSTLTGILWMVVTGLLFVAVTGVVRFVGSEIPAAESAFIRYVIGLILVLPFMGPLFRRRFSSKTLGLFAFRGLAHGLAVILWFFAMARIPLAEVTAIGYTTPIFVTIGAALFLSETLALRRMAAIGVAFIGAMIILRPGFQEVSIGQLAQLGAAPLFAVSYLLAKQFSGDESPIVIVGMLSVVVTIVLAPFAISVWVTPTLVEVLALGLVAVLATSGHYTMTLALRAAPIATTQPVTFLQLVWAATLGFFAFGERVDLFVILGGSLIIAAVSFITYREAVLRRPTTTPPSNATKL